jgi:hypothetical protein
MSVNLSPVGNGISFLGTTGLPLAGGLLYTYQAGSSTPLTSYTDVNGLIPNTNPIVLGTDGRLPSELWFQAGYNYKLVLTDAASNLIATYDNLYGILGTVPAVAQPFTTGMIILWSGSVGSVPSGWQLCNGQNGAPDLRDSFIVGAGNSYSVGQTGGSTDAIVVSHTHTAIVTDPGHNHTYQEATGLQPQSGSSTNCLTSLTTANTSTATTGITVANQSTGTSGSGANLPPYYALAYIYKL